MGVSVSAPLSTLQSHNSGICTCPLRGSCYLRICHSSASATEGLILELEKGWLWSEKFAKKAVSIKAINGLRCASGKDKKYCVDLNFLSQMEAGPRQFILIYFSVVLHLCL